jgi:hypothetical protein
MKRINSMHMLKKYRQVIKSGGNSGQASRRNPKADDFK